MNGEENRKTEAHMLSWLENEPQTMRAHLKTIFDVMLIGAGCSVLGGFILDILGFMAARNAVETAITKSVVENPWHMSWVVLREVTREELQSRIAPLICAVLLTRFVRKLWLITATVVIASAEFGWGHGGFHLIFVHGFIGVALCIVYLKCGGMRGGWGFLKAALIVITVHFTFDSIVLAKNIIRSALS